METEVHVYALAIAASHAARVHPFLMVIARVLPHNGAALARAEQAIYLALNDFFAPDAGGFFSRNSAAMDDLKAQRHIHAPADSFTAKWNLRADRSGAETARWGVPKNRSYLRNQLVSFGLILLCGGLARCSR
jgi:hypothetical protein